MTILAIVALTTWLTGILLTLWGTFRSHKHFKGVPPNLDMPYSLVPVSILKPCKGIETGFYKNLESFFQLDYPIFEILFSVAHPNDPAIESINKLRNAYPKVKTSLFIGDISLGTNPKVNNMIKSYDHAKYEWILISDSNVRVHKSYLKRQVAHIGNDVGIVTSVVAGREASTLGGHLEAMYLNTFYARWMIMAQAFKEYIVVGKSMLFRKSISDRFGGLKTLSRYLAEDYMAGQAMKMLGLKVVTACDPIVQPIGNYTVAEFWNRHLRWGRIRKAQAFVPFLLEPCFSAFGSAILGLIGFQVLFGIDCLFVFAVHVLVWAAADISLHLRLTQSQKVTPAFFMWFLREFTHLPMWAQTLFGKKVFWRGRYLRILPGGLLES